MQGKNRDVQSRRSLLAAPPPSPAPNADTVFSFTSFYPSHGSSHHLEQHYEGGGVSSRSRGELKTVDESESPGCDMCHPPTASPCPTPIVTHSPAPETRSGGGSGTGSRTSTGVGSANRPKRLSPHYSSERSPSVTRRAQQHERFLHTTNNTANPQHRHSSDELLSPTPMRLQVELPPGYSSSTIARPRRSLYLTVGPEWDGTGTGTGAAAGSAAGSHRQGIDRSRSCPLSATNSAGGTPTTPQRPENALALAIDRECECDRGRGRKKPDPERTEQNSDRDLERESTSFVPGATRSRAPSPAPGGPTCAFVL